MSCSARPARPAAPPPASQRQPLAPASFRCGGRAFARPLQSTKRLRQRSLRTLPKPASVPPFSCGFPRNLAPAYYHFPKYCHSACLERSRRDWSSPAFSLSRAKREIACGFCTPARFSVVYDIVVVNRGRQFESIVASPSRSWLPLAAEGCASSRALIKLPLFSTLTKNTGVGGTAV